MHYRDSHCADFCEIWYWGLNMEIFRENPNLVKNRLKYLVLCMKPCVNIITGGDLKSPLTL